MPSPEQYLFLRHRPFFLWLPVRKRLFLSFVGHKSFRCRFQIVRNSFWESIPFEWFRRKLLTCPLFTSLKTQPLRQVKKKPNLFVCVKLEAIRLKTILFVKTRCAAKREIKLSVESRVILVVCCFSSVLTRGDLNILRWLESNHLKALDLSPTVVNPIWIVKNPVQLTEKTFYYIQKLIESAQLSGCVFGELPLHLG